MEMAIVVLVVVEVLQHLRIFVIIQNDLPRLVHSFFMIFHVLTAYTFCVEGISSHPPSLHIYPTSPLL